MNNKVLILLPILMFSIPAYAISGTLSLHGKIIENACDSVVESTDLRCAKFVQSVGLEQQTLENLSSLADVQQAIKNNHQQLASVVVETIPDTTQAANLVVSYR